MQEMNNIKYGNCWFMHIVWMEIGISFGNLLKFHSILGCVAY